MTRVTGHDINDVGFGLSGYKISEKKEYKNDLFKHTGQFSSKKSTIWE